VGHAQSVHLQYQTNSDVTQEEMTGRWVDPFSGYNSPAQVTNDLDPETPAQCHTDALDFLKGFPDSSFDGAIFDPPYSFYELRRCYKAVGKDAGKWGALNNYWSKCKDELGRIVKPDGKVISFGWQSMGLDMAVALKLIGYF